MWVNDVPDGVEIVLSRRNLQTLLNKLADPKSLKTIYMMVTQGNIYIRAEEDAVHYAHREPGEMHPDHVPVAMPKELM